MANIDQMTSNTSNVEVVVWLGPPLHYVARYGAGGWCEAGGWTETDAVVNLAQALINDPPADVPIALLDDPQRLIEWVRRGYDLPTLRE